MADAFDELLNGTPDQPQQPTANAQQPDAFDALLGSAGGDAVNNAPAPKQSTFMDAVEGFNRSFGRVSEGTVQLVANAMGWNNVARVQKQVHDAAEQSNAMAAQRSPIANTIGGVLGDIGMGVYATAAGTGVTSAPGISKLVGGIAGYSPAANLGVTAAGGGLGGAAMGGLSYADSLDQRIKNMEYGGAVGAAVPVGFAALKALGKATPLPEMVKKYFAAKPTAVKDLAEQAAAQGETPTTIANKIASANELGIPVTPGEALGGPLRDAEIKNMVLTESTKPSVISSLQAKESGAKNLLKDTIDNIAAPDNKEQVGKLFDSFKNNVVPEDQLQPLLNNPSIAGRLKAMANNVDSVAKDLPDNSFIKLNEIKKGMDSELFSDAFNKPAVPLTPDVKMGINNARQQIKDVLASVDPNYVEANKLAQKGILQGQFNDLYDKLKEKVGGNQSPSVTEIYNKFFGTAEKRGYFLDGLAQTADTPEEAKTLISNTNKLIDVMSKVQDSTLAKVIKKGVPSDSNSGGLFGMLSNAVDKATIGDSYKNTVIDLMLDQSKWAPAISKILSKKTMAQKVTEFVNQISPFAKGVGEGTTGSKLLTPAIQQSDSSNSIQDGKGEDFNSLLNNVDAIGING